MKENQSSYPRLNSNCTNIRADDKQTSYLQVLREENEESSLSLMPQEIVNICYSCVPHTNHIKLISLSFPVMAGKGFLIRKEQHGLDELG